MTTFGLTRADRVVGYGLLAGGVLTLIGLRFLIWPQSAAYTFGIDPEETAFAFHSVIGLRDVWLGLLAVAFAVSRNFAALALWFLLGVFVCAFDARIVFSSGGPTPAIVFHALSGVFCLAAGLAAYFEARAA